MLIHQAIYTSCQTHHASGYQLVAGSVGIAEADLRELSLWGPSHDSLWEGGTSAVSVNFHRLPSGAWCISQTTPAGAEYSQRRGPQVYTQSLIVDGAGLAEFGNNPFSLLQASIALGHVAVHEKVPKRLDPFWIDADHHHESADDLALLVKHPGPVWVGLLLDLALSSSALGIVAGERGAGLVAALIECLPRDCRTEFSFTTGLRFSLRRPFRVVCLPNHAADNQRLVRQQRLAIFEPKGPPPETTQLGGWASFVTAAIASGNTHYLAAELARPRDGLSLSGLDRLGEQLVQGLRALQPSSVAESSAGSQASACSDQWRADGAHRGVSLIAAQVAAEHAPSANASDFQIEEEPARAIGESCPAALENLHRLEDAIFEALAGKSVLSELATLWPLVVSQVGPARIEATREEYLRYTLAVWRQLNAAGHLSDPHRAQQAMQLICLLFDQ